MMSDRTKVGLGIALFALVVAMPLSATSLPQTEAPTETISVEMAGPMACEGTEVDGATASCSEEAAAAATRAAERACEELGGELHSIEFTCWSLGGGGEYWRADASCRGVH